MKGEFNGLCLARALYQKREKAILQWDSVEYDSKAYIIRMTPSIRVARDQTIKDPGNWGFNVYNGKGEEVPITAVRIVDKGMCVTLEMSAAVEPGPHRSVDYALNSHHVRKLKRTRTSDIPRGQIRTRHPFGTSYHDRLPLHAYMPHAREYF
ncbi:hypothetical protein GCM10027287_29780 [Bordetella muralis]